MTDIDEDSSERGGTSLACALAAAVARRGNGVPTSSAAHVVTEEMYFEATEEQLASRQRVAQDCASAWTLLASCQRLSSETSYLREDCRASQNISAWVIAQPLAAQSQRGCCPLVAEFFQCKEATRSGINLSTKIDRRLHPKTRPKLSFGYAWHEISQVPTAA